MKSHSKERATTVARGPEITLSPELISRITTFPLGFKWNKENMPSTIAKRNIVLSAEEFIEDKNGVRIGSLPYP